MFASFLSSPPCHVHVLFFSFFSLSLFFLGLLLFLFSPVSFCLRFLCVVRLSVNVQARWKITQKSTVNEVVEHTGVAIITKGKWVRNALLASVYTVVHRVGYPTIWRVNGPFLSG